MIFDAAGRQLIWNNETISLTEKECRVVEMLAKSDGLSAVEMATRLYGPVSSYTASKRINVAITAIRKKLRCAGWPAFIKTLTDPKYQIEGRLEVIGVTRSLTPELREMIYELWQVEGLTTRQVAAQVNLPLNRVEHTIEYGRRLGIVRRRPTVPADRPGPVEAGSLSPPP
jgi:DNA-directed RNA polymerase specialized sigma24 family protein